MPKVSPALTAIEVRRLVEPGVYQVGTVPGLRLRVAGPDARSWTLRTMVGGRRVEMGLGGYPAVTLAGAIERARQALDGIRTGVDPLAEKRKRRVVIEWTFDRAAQAYIDAHRAGWKNAKHADQWVSTLATYASPVFGSLHVSAVDKACVLEALAPIWTEKTETAARLRSRIELVLNYATHRGWRPEGANPARWRGNLDAVLPKPSKVAPVDHHAAVPWRSMPAFWSRLASVDGMGAQALRFCILTAARSGEVRGATWAEIDLDGAAWSIDASRMKAGRPHRVPLSPAAVQLLRELPQLAGVPLVFPGNRLREADDGSLGPAPLSDMTLSAVLRRLEVPATVHGMRSAFRDWAAESTSFPPEVVEMALAHVVGNATEAAYRRGDLFERRRELMASWSGFVAGAGA
ncbi:MAG: hypothetical protein RL722_2276 [Pseudomonadota bacterium]|jgi:integrase